MFQMHGKTTLAVPAAASRHGEKREKEGSRKKIVP